MRQKEEGDFTYFAKIDKIYRKVCGKAVAEYDFTPNEILVLMFLSNNQELNSASDIAQCRNISKGLVAKSVESLCEKGYLTTGKDKKDRRLVHLYLTEKSQKVVARIKTCKQEFMEELHKGIPAEDLEALNRTAKVMNRNLENMLRLTEKS
ncbi:MarR family winged helix-turn-helix transcriptional regulator [Clostridium sp. Marseille-P2415]|uniref:MarR family winged helix-turn-helix transcriptional regulator n=1 Tax=Clostridium sp. Marseille-P2415 TaxID=1805471 RepID=UPI00098862DC|nr:MarR family winged helix-turn-helix transcriptional regulator [Clostridium sp. Marseille-P2415]